MVKERRPGMCEVLVGEDVEVEGITPARQACESAVRQARRLAV